MKSVGGGVRERRGARTCETESKRTGYSTVVSDNVDLVWESYKTELELINHNGSFRLEIKLLIKLKYLFSLLTSRSDIAF